MRILLVDDEPTDALATRRLLRLSPLHEAEVVVEQSGKDAVVRQSDGFDCILLDEHLPDGLGSDVVQQLKANAPYMAVVLLTGQGSELIAANAMRAGADDYLSKVTLSSDILVQTILRATDKVRLRQELDKQRTELKSAHTEILRYVSMLERLAAERGRKNRAGAPSGYHEAVALLNDRIEHLEALLTESREQTAVCFRVTDDVQDELRLALEPTTNINRKSQEALIDVVKRGIDSLHGLSRNTRWSEEKLDWVPVDLGEALDQAVAELWPQLTKAELRVNGFDLPVIPTVANLPTRVFVHILENILRIHLRSTTVINVTALELASYCRLTFTMDRAYAEALARNNARIVSLEGADRGLILARTLMEENGGRLTIDTEAPGGLTVLVDWLLGPTDDMLPEPSPSHAAELPEPEPAAAV